MTDAERRAIEADCARLIALYANLNDEAQSWRLDSEGDYTRDPAWKTKGAFSAHDYFMTNPSLSGRGRKAKSLPAVLRYERPGR